MESCLPEIKNQALIPEYFPSAMQAFIFRNWEMVDKTRLAAVLGTSEENVEAEAERMGLGKQKNPAIWMEKGYITIIRANWHLLPYEQLLELLGWTEEKLAMVLKEEDFLDVKMGCFKPMSEKITYRELTDDEIKKTEKIKAAMDSLNASISDEKEPFDFWSKEKEKIMHKAPSHGQVVVDNSWSVINETGSKTVEEMADRFAVSMKEAWGVELQKEISAAPSIVLSYVENKKDEYHEIHIKENEISIKAGASAGILRGLYRLEDMAKMNGGAFYDKADYIREPRFGARYIYSFCGLYEGALDVDSSTYCPDSLLEEYARTGVNGIWLQGVLYRLIEFPYAPEMSEGWEKRLENLRSFAQRAEKYGIRIFMYINEPRTMPLSFFDKYPDMKGAESGQYACMCVSSVKTQKYLHDTIEKVCTAVPNLGGFFTITMSENLTHCKSRKVNVPCERCAEVAPRELVAKVNGIIAEAAHKVNPSIKVIAWDWSWSPSLGMEEEDVKYCIEAMPQEVVIMCKRESAIPFTRGGIDGAVKDYSISVEGVSEMSRKEWKWAKESGHEIAAKLQINNSWECSTTPYLPVYRTLYNQIERMLEVEVDHLMLSWTLGGYPSPSIRMISEAFFIENGQTELDFDKALSIVYAERADEVKQATDKFCEAFSEFPFDLSVLYVGPQNGGASNPLYHKPTGYRATMTCYAYDALDDWRSIYPAEILQQQYGLVSDKWEEGMKLLSDGELKDISYISYSLFRASYNQVKFVRLRDEYLEKKTPELKKELLETVKSERELALKVHKIMCRRPEVGFEAANHYYYSKETVKEKIINCDWLIEYYSE